MLRDRKGFTLIELLVVIIIIGILASVSIHMLRNVTTKAVGTEAISVLGTIWTAQKTYYVEYGDYAANMTNLFAAGFLKYDDLNGSYFGKSSFDYMMIAGGPGKPELYHMCRPYFSTCSEAPNADQVNRYWGGQVITESSYICMDQQGHILSDISALGYPPFETGGPPPVQP